MNVLWKCTIRQLKGNRGRTLVAILGVALATALITAVAALGSSMLESEVAYLKKSNECHVLYLDVLGENLKYFENNQSLEKVQVEKKVGYAYMEDNPAFYLEVSAPEESSLSMLERSLVSGRLPAAENEIVLGKDVRSRHGMNVKLGDHVKLSYGKRVADDQEILFRERYRHGETLDVTNEKEYVVVGFVKGGERNITYEAYSGENKNVVAAWIGKANEREDNALYDVNVRYNSRGLQNMEEINDTLGALSKGTNTNQALIGFESPKYFLKEDPGRIGVIALIELVFMMIILAGVFCINNSFDLTFTERIRFYGMMTSVGMTKRQKRRLVWLEAFFIGCIGIPFGVLLGIGLNGIAVKVINLAIRLYARKSGFVMAFRISWWAILIAVVQAAFMVLLSAAESAVRASKLSPIAALRSNDTIKECAKKKKTPYLIKRIFGVGGVVAWQNFKRSKVKYRATVISIAVSVAMLSGTSFLNLIFQDSERVLNSNAPCQVTLNVSKEDGRESLLKLAKTPGVTESVILDGAAVVYVEDGEIPYGPDAYVNSDKKFIYIMAYDDAYFSKLCNKIGLDPEEARGKALIYAGYEETYRDQKGQMVTKRENIAEFQKGEVIRGEYVNAKIIKEELPRIETSVTVAGQLNEMPIGFSTPSGIVYAIVDESFRNTHPDFFTGRAEGFFFSDDVDALEDAILDADLLDYYYENYDGQLQSMRFTKTLITVLIAGFIGVILLIGCTNVINAVSFNMELRASEFAKLKSIGMTAGQFQKMIFAEGVFLGGKGLLWGLGTGYAISYAFYRFYWESSDKNFELRFGIPAMQTIGSILMVSVLLCLVMRYGCRKAMKRNVIETIRKENL